MPHKRTKAVGKLLFFDNKTTPRSIDRFGIITFRIDKPLLMSLQMSLALPHYGERQSLIIKDNITDISSSNLTFRKENSSSRFSANEKTKDKDLSSLHSITPHLREPTREENSFIPCFFSQEALILACESDGFRLKKRRN